MPASPKVTIQLRGLSVHTNHGVGAAEREVGQRMIFDLDLVPADCPATDTDELDGTIDYGAVTELLVETATEKSYLTLERLSMVIARNLLDAFPADSVRIRAHKVEPPIPFTMESGGVELYLERDGGAAGS